jgi:hypothetical protein
MADLHEMIVYHVRQMIGRETVILHDDLIIDVLVVKNHLAVHDVLELRLTVRHLHSNDVTLAASLALLYNFFRQLQAGPIVLGLRVLLTPELDSHFLQSFCGAEAAVSVACLSKVKIKNLPQADGCSTFGRSLIAGSGCMDHVDPSCRLDAFRGIKNQGPRPRSCLTTSALR